MRPLSSLRNGKHEFADVYMTTERQPPMQNAQQPARQTRRCTVAWLDVLGTVLLGISLAMATPAVRAAGPDATLVDQPIRQFLVNHCLECHGAEKSEGELRLDRLFLDIADPTHHATWQATLRRVQAGEMPPEEKPRPSAKEIETLAEWINGQTAGQAAHGRVTLRRLNRTEYENTVCDLLGVKVNLKDQLPEDGEANGFDNAAAALHMSSFLMERYLEAADTALDQGIANGPRPPLIQKRIRLADVRQVKVTRESVYRHLDDAVVCFSSSPWQTISLSGFYPPHGGNYRFRISASGYQSSGQPISYRVTSGQTRLAGKDGLVGYFDAPADQPRVAEFIQYMEPRTTISILPYGLAGSRSVNQVGADHYEGPGLAVQWVEVEGPLHDAWPPDSHRRIFGELEQKSSPIHNFRDRVEVVSQQPLVDAERILRSFTRRAFRRPVSDDDVQPFVDIVQARLAVGYSFEQAVRAALKGVLLAPDFLFLRELPGRLDDNALASRLSYFLWSTMPDEELLSLAEQQKLGQNEVLRGQVERMLSNPKSAALTENFVGQWLGLREIDFTEPSRLLYPEYDHMLKVSMIREPELFFQAILNRDLSVSNFIASDFTLLNGRLARHYEIAGPVGWEFQEVALPPGSHRGGVLTMASVLKVTANGTTTSPVMRGVWVLDRILGTPPSPPPDEVPGIEPDIRGATTIRDQLAKHRELGACASCHTKIDPPGFALESFDVIGGWRDHYRIRGRGARVIIDGQRMSYNKGEPIDPADVMASGRRFENVDEFKQLLLEDKDPFARAFTSKLLAYATGAAPTTADQAEIQRIVSDVREHDYGLRSLLHGIVQSELFRNK